MINPFEITFIIQLYYTTLFINNKQIYYGVSLLRRTIVCFYKCNYSIIITLKIIRLQTYSPGMYHIDVFLLFVDFLHFGQIAF